MTQVLRDRRHAAALERDGFAVIAGFAPDVVDELRAGFGELHGWDGEGFHADLTVDDPSYRQATSDRIAKRLDARATALFVDHRPFLRNYICKFPGAESALYLHRDWMYVDERRGGRTFVAWTALEDITGHNGQLQVLRGSHKIDSSLRGTELVARWIEREDVIRARLEAIPVRAGDCIVFDNALVHCSYPNHTDRPRVVAAVAMRPTHAPLVHFRRRDESTAERFDVDDRFFLDYTPVQLLAAPPDLPVVETVADDQVELDDDELAAAIDGHAGRRRRSRALRPRVGLRRSIAT
jgi:hypothetical protein